ncbi:uncharacterized protein EI97DRAFT_224567 [Westerdykella ornata]|uniref:FAD-binding FR-type domain-containing protein n=1 Tax=Westerdykella ornata TaxID=318751 RepID=A0A6A6JTA1_WESOR|nr:uncharacterized protein EI97DRAFT_224567 [Westerdykella ornata]KAF2278976.1 hypothetical protein EI97DRAFT_224567 [Westerdykella ornata]
MHVTILYAIAYASTISLILLWKAWNLIVLRARERFLSVVSRWLFYTVVFPRARGSTDATIFSVALAILFAVGNIVGSTLAVQTKAELSMRLARLSILNMVVLFVGGRTNIVIDKLLKWTITEYSFLHRWIGRVSLVEALLHGLLYYLDRRSINAYEISLLAVTAAIGCMSFVYVRRRIYETFLSTHRLLSFAVLILSWLHITHLGLFSLVCLISAVTLFSIQKILWLGFFLYRNLGSGPRCEATLVRYPNTFGTEEIVQLQVSLKRPWNVRPGQYVYLSLRQPAYFWSGIVESHPYMVAWASDSDDASSHVITLLVQCRRGFSRRLSLTRMRASTPQHMSASIDGPYGGAGLEKLQDYDKVLFMADGIGIAHHLMPVRHLLVSHNKQTARIRRLTLIWFLRSRDQMCWAVNFLLALHDLDDRKILNIFITTPSSLEGSAEGRNSALPELRSRIYMLNEIDIDLWINEEWQAEAGNMLTVGKYYSPYSS